MTSEIIQWLSPPGRYGKGAGPIVRQVEGSGTVITEQDEEVYGYAYPKVLKAIETPGGEYLVVKRPAHKSAEGYRPVRYMLLWWSYRSLRPVVRLANSEPGRAWKKVLTVFENFSG